MSLLSSFIWNVAIAIEDVTSRLGEYSDQKTFLGSLSVRHMNNWKTEGYPAIKKQ